MKFKCLSTNRRVFFPWQNHQLCSLLITQITQMSLSILSAFYIFRVISFQTSPQCGACQDSCFISCCKFDPFFKMNRIHFADFSLQNNSFIRKKNIIIKATTIILQQSFRGYRSTHSGHSHRCIAKTMKSRKTRLAFRFNGQSEEIIVNYKAALRIKSFSRCTGRCRHRGYHNNTSKCIHNNLVIHVTAPRLADASIFGEIVKRCQLSRSEWQPSTTILNRLRKT